MVIVKCQAIWSGFQGAPGYTNMYAISDGDAPAAANALGTRMRAFFSACAVMIPTRAHVKVQRAYQVLEATNGHITSEGNLTTDPADVVGGSGLAYSGASGAAINWETGLYNALGHRVRGRTYLVPLSNVYEDNGTLASVSIAAIEAAAANLLGGLGGIGVFTRPTTPGGSDGNFRLAVSARVSDKAAILRSRRD
jgi:hypothetical protein